MKRFKEPLKTLLILLLTASAVFLAWKGSLFSAFFPEKPSPVTPSPEIQEQSYTAAALPFAAAVRGPGGLCCGVKYDALAMAELYEGFSAILSETLGSAEAPEVISRFVWQDRLQEESLYLDYGFDLPISVVAAWVGVEAPWAGRETGSAFLLDHNGAGNVRLNYRGGDGRFFQCATAASWATLRVQLEEYRPNGASFAFEQPVLDDCAPFLLVLEKLPPLYGVSASADRTAAAGVFAELFGVNLSGQSRYTEADGTLVYPGENGVLRLWADGSIGYNPSEQKGQAASSAADQIEGARKLLETIHASFAGEESLSLRSAEADEAWDLTLLFCYVLDGIRLDLPGGPAARAVWKEGRLSELMIRPQSCRRSQEVFRLLPEKQAAAAAGSLRRESAPELILLEAGEERFDPGWVVTVDGRSQWTQED